MDPSKQTQAVMANISTLYDQIIGYPLVGYLPLAMLVLLCTLWIIRIPRAESWLSNMPYVGTKEEFRANCKELLRIGYQKYGDGWWRLDTPDGDRVVMPHKHIEELKNRPRAHLSFTKANSDILLGKYTGIDEVNEQSIEVVRLDLTRNIANLLPVFEEETEYAFRKEISDCHEWTAIDLHSRILRIVSMVSNRFFVGPQVSREEDWIKTSIQYTADVFGGGQQLKSWKPVFRPVVFRLLKPMRRLAQMKATARRLLIPILKAREKERHVEGDSYKPPKDTIQWMQERSAHISTFDFREQAHMQLIIGLAAIHTTGMATTHMIYDIAARPSYVEPLRQEIRQVLNDEGGRLTKNALSKLRLMDSFMKESQRLNPIALTFFTRKTSVPIVLRDGTRVPAGTHLTCNEQVPSDNPDVWGHLDKFDGFRFARCVDREADDGGKLNFTTTSAQSLAFGHGRHACPGRYFAAAEIKSILCYLLLNYDIKFPEAVIGRPDNIFFETAIMPDPSQTVLFKNISSG